MKISRLIALLQAAQSRVGRDENVALSVGGVSVALIAVDVSAHDCGGDVCNCAYPMAGHCLDTVILMDVEPAADTFFPRGA